MNDDVGFALCCLVVGFITSLDLAMALTAEGIVSLIFSLLYAFGGLTLVTIAFLWGKSQ